MKGFILAILLKYFPTVKCDLICQNFNNMNFFTNLSIALSKLTHRVFLNGYYQILTIKFGFEKRRES